jgi:hypothetical protein
MELSFEEFTKAEVVAALGVDLYLVDVVTIEIANKRPKPGEGETKLVHAYKFETEEGLQYISLFGINKHRDRHAAGFASGALAGIKYRIGPMGMEKRDTGNIQPAWVFVKRPGFQIKQQ